RQRPRRARHRPHRAARRADARGPGHRVRRREAIALLAGAIAGAPIAARAQAPRNGVARILLLRALAETDYAGQRWGDRLRDALRRYGWVDGTNVDLVVRLVGQDPLSVGRAQAGGASKAEFGRTRGELDRWRRVLQEASRALERFDVCL